MCEVAKETLYSPFKSHLPFLDLLYVCVAVCRNLSIEGFLAWLWTLWRLFASEVIPSLLSCLYILYNGVLPIQSLIHPNEFVLYE